MTTSIKGKLIGVLGGLLLVGGLAAYAVKLSLASNFAIRETSIAAAGEHHAIEAAAVKTDARGRVEPVTAMTFDEQVLRSSVPVLVDFYADWCGSCQFQHEILKKLAAEAEGFKIVKVDVDRDVELAQRFEVEALPTLLIVKDGRVIGRHVGVATKQQLLAELDG